MAKRKGWLPTATSLHNHIPVILKGYLLFIIHIQHGYRTQLRRDATRSRSNVRVGRIDQRLNDGVICYVHMVCKRIFTFSFAMKSFVKSWSYDPIVPTYICEVYSHCMSSTRFTFLVSSSSVSNRPFLTVFQDLLALSVDASAVIRIDEEERLLVNPIVAVVSLQP